MASVSVCCCCEDLSSYLLTVEPDGGDGVGVAAVLEPVEDGGLPTSVQPQEHTVIARPA